MRSNLQLIFLLLCGCTVYAQTRQISGRVTDTGSNSPIPGVNVSLQGTTTGSITDVEGNYAIAASTGSVLVFSFVGMEPQSVTVGTGDVINVQLNESSNMLEGIVVTALGIKREEKTLTYATQTVGGDELTRTRDPNVMNSLAGKAAGIEIKRNSSGAGGSTKVVLRGNKSLSGDSSPLFVIDGIPMANNRGGQPGMWGGTDRGDGLSAINPEDIESISILRGSNAAVLYGSQGANGVILITTKSGASGKTVVTLNSGFTAENYIELPHLQYNYGAIGNAKESWDTNRQNYDDSFVKDFFRTGSNFYNALSISGGTDKTRAYFSYANTAATGIAPNNTYNKHNFSFKQSTKFWDDKVTVSSNVIMALESTKNRIAAGYYLNPLTGLYMFPRQRNFNDYRENYAVFNTARNLYAQNWFVADHHQSNPYWIVNKQPKSDDFTRIIGNLNIAYQISPELAIQVRGNG